MLLRLISNFKICNKIFVCKKNIKLVRKFLWWWFSGWFLTAGGAALVVFLPDSGSAQVGASPDGGAAQFGDLSDSRAAQIGDLPNSGTAKVGDLPYIGAAQVALRMLSNHHYMCKSWPYFKFQFFPFSNLSSILLHQCALLNRWSVHKTFKCLHTVVRIFECCDITNK